MKKRLLFLLMLLALGLTACGRSAAEENSGSGRFYSAERMEKPAQLDEISGGCALGEALYLTGFRLEPLANGMARREAGQLLRVSRESGVAEPLPEYQTAGAAEAQRSSCSSMTLRTGSDGTLWEAEKICDQFYDLPEGFDEENDDLRPYFSGEQVYWVLRQLDQEGRELFRFEENAGELEDRLQIGTVSGLLMDGSGEIVVLGATGAAVLSREGAVRFTLPVEEPETINYPPRLILLGDGRAGMAEFAQEGDGYYIRLQTIDKEAGSWGKKYLLPSMGGVYDGGDGVLFYYLAGDELRAWREDTQDAGTGETVLNWAVVGIDYNELRVFAITDNGRMLAITSEGDFYTPSEDIAGPQLFLLKTVEGQGECKVLTYATLEMDSEVRTAVLEFNRTNSDYRIVVKDYTDYSPNGSREDAIMRLATEIGAGKVPDILAIEDMPVEQWAAVGLLEDLWPWIDRDPDISREDLMERVFRSMEIDGKLYEISDTFAMRAVIGRKDIVGDRMTWTPDEWEAALAKMPEGSIGIDEGGVELLLNMMRLDWGQFLNWEKGECSFDSEEFKSLLAFCGRFPQSISGNRFNMVNAGQQMVATFFADSFQAVQVANAVAKGDAAFVGYPNPWGRVGSSFSIFRTLSMSSACPYKEGAWAFMRALLLPHEPEQINYYQRNNYFYTNKTDFQRSAQKAMSDIWEENPFTMNYGDVSVQYDGVTQAEYNQLMALYDAIDTIYRRDSNLETIIREAAGAYFAGDKTLDETAALIQNRVALYVNEQK